MRSWNQDEVAAVHGWVRITNKLVKDVTPNVRRSAEAYPELKRSGMVERDAVAPRVTPNGARNGAIDFTAFDLNNDRHFVPGAGRGAGIDYLPAQGGSIAIVQRDILRMGGRGRTDALGSAGLVVACRRVIDVDREGA